MLRKYIICVDSTDLKNERIMLINRDDYDVYKHEPLTDSDNLEEAHSFLKVFKSLVL